MSKKRSFREIQSSASSSVDFHEEIVSDSSDGIYENNAYSTNVSVDCISQLAKHLKTERVEQIPNQFVKYENIDNESAAFSNLLANQNNAEKSQQPLEVDQKEERHILKVESNVNFALQLPILTSLQNEKSVSKEITEKNQSEQVTVLEKITTATIEPLIRIIKNTEEPEVKNMDHFNLKNVKTEAENDEDDIIFLEEKKPVEREAMGVVKEEKVKTERKILKLNNNIIVRNDYLTNKVNDEITSGTAELKMEINRPEEVSLVLPKEDYHFTPKSMNVDDEYELRQLLKREYPDVYANRNISILNQKNMSILDLALFRPYLNLTHLKIINCDVEFLLGLPSKRFKSPSSKRFSKLESLTVRSNSIEYLDERVFWELNRLEEIDFSFNKISELRPALFKGLKNLKRVFFIGNQLHSLPADLFCDTLQLEQVDFSDNNLKELSSTLFQGHKTLRLIYLSQNDLKTLHVDLFKGLINLRHLKLSKNQLSRLDERLFVDMENLAYLNFANNKIETLPDNLFASMDQLEFLIGANNCIRDLHERLFVHTVKLHQIDFSNNKIRYMGKNLFKNITSLTKLDLSSNRIRFIYKNDFFDFEKVCQKNFNDNPNLKIC